TGAPGESVGVVIAGSTPSQDQRPAQPSRTTDWSAEQTGRAYTAGRRPNRGSSPTAVASRIAIAAAGRWLGQGSVSPRASIFPRHWVTGCCATPLAACLFALAQIRPNVLLSAPLRPPRYPTVPTHGRPARPSPCAVTSGS